MGRSRRRGLGMGLQALLGEAAPRAGQDSGLRLVPLEYLEPSPLQPRQQFSEAELEELAHSLRTHGLLQPLLVRPSRALASGYEIIAGERRWRAAQRAGLHELPCIVRELDDREALEIGLVENLQRQDLDPLEEAAAYQRLVEHYGRRPEEIARAVGKSRSHVANTLRLLGLPEAVRRHLREGRLSAGHGRALLAARQPERLAEIIVARKLSVRDTEALVRRERRLQPARNVRPQGQAEEPDIPLFARELSRRLGLRVMIRHRGRGGEIVIRYSDLAQLADLCRRLIK